MVAPISENAPSPRLVGISCEYRAMAVVTPSWKLAYFPEQDEGRLWDRRRDPAEQVDLFSTASMARNATVWAAKHGLLLALLRWRAQQDALGFMQANMVRAPSPHKAPTAFHVVNHTRSLRGIDAELRLQVDALQFEPGAAGVSDMLA